MTNPDPGSLISMGAAESEGAAAALINRVSEFIGGALKPMQTRRVAEAEADAALIRARGDAEVQEVLQKAGFRRELLQSGFRTWAEGLAREQANRQAIVLKAADFLEEAATPEKVHDDWFAEFFDRCRLTSDEQMQAVWARLLAGEANAPGSFSKQTVQLVAHLDHGDAQRFRELCGATWRLDHFVVPLIPMNDSLFPDVYVDDVSHARELQTLRDLGLIHYDRHKGFRTQLGKYFVANYFGRKMTFQTDLNDRALRVGQVIFTRAGRQLFEICGAEPIPSMWEWGIDYIGRQKFRPDESSTHG